MREYPPVLQGTAEQQTAQLRAYLVRLCSELDAIDQRSDSAAASLQDSLAAIKAEINDLKSKI